MGILTGKPLSYFVSLAAFLTAAIASTLVFLTYNHYEFGHIMEHEHEEVLTRVSYLRPGFEVLIRRGDEAGLAELTMGLLGDSNITDAALIKDGTPLASFRKKDDSHLVHDLEDSAHSSVIREARETGRPAVLDKDDGIFYIAVPLDGDGKAARPDGRWLLLCEVDVRYFGIRVKQTAMYAGAVSSSIILCMSLALSVLVRRKISEPLFGMSRAADKIKAGDYGVRLPMSRRIEFGTLASAFNEMAQTLGERDKHITSLNRKLLDMVEVNEKIASEVEVGAVLDRICETVVGSYGLKLAWIGLVKKDSVYLTPPAAFYGVAAGMLEGLSVTRDDTALGTGPCGVACRTARPAVFNDVGASGEPASWEQRATEFGLKSIAGIPLIFKDECLGVLVLSSGEKGFFTDELIGVLQPLARQAAIAIDKAALIAEVTNAKAEWETTFDAIPDLVYIVDREHNVVRANAATAVALERPWDEIIGMKCHNVFHGMAEVPGYCPSRKVFSNCETDVSEVKDIMGKGHFLVTSAPITGPGGQVDRVIHTVKDITALREVDERLREEAFISNSILKVVDAVSSTMDTGEILQGISAITSELVRCESVSIYLWDRKLQAYVPGAQYGYHDDYMPVFNTLKFRMGDVPLFDRVAISDGPLVCGQDDQADEIPSNVREMLGLKSVVATPIQRHGELLGIIVVNIPGATAGFSLKEYNLLKAISKEAAGAIDNARLYRQAQERTVELARRIETISTMNEIDKAILSTFTKEQIISIVGHSIRQLVPCDHISISLADGDGSYATTSMAGDELMTKRRWTTGESLGLDRVSASGRSYYLPDIKAEDGKKEKERLMHAAGIRSALFQPVKAGNKLVGILNLGSSHVAGFTIEDMNNVEKLSYQVAVALENSRLFGELDNLFLSTIRAMSMAIDAKSHWTHGHSVRVTQYAVAIAREMGFDAKGLRDLEVGGLLHDVGKIGTYESILDKPGKLTDEEYAVVKQHPDKGVSIVSEIKQLKDILPIIRHHHERFDGRGYPSGLAGEDTPLPARVLALADAYDSIISDRPYRVSPGKAWAVEEIKRCSGSQFDPAVVEAFLKVMDRAPFV